jgi:hypothetical protein
MVCAAHHRGAGARRVAGGSARDLSQFFGPTVELAFDGDKQSYSATQAEFVMKDFFAKNAPASFEYDHQKTSAESIQYAAGKYVGKTGSYQVFVQMKPVSGNLVIDSINFTKE